MSLESSLSADFDIMSLQYCKGREYHEILAGIGAR